ncbi:MAG TPA: cytochrome c family protein [Hyphomonadaceae bacterium]|nr:cytochrome c family protein [Hyphomonadaceae bacterium]
MTKGYLIPLIAGLALLAACGNSKSAPAASSAPAVPAPTVAELPAPYNEGNVGHGKSLFSKCQSCHSVDARDGNSVGPNLHGVFDRKPGTAPKFRYSPAMAGFTSEKWTPELVDEWLAKPQTFLPGTAMTFNGFAKPEDRRDIVAWLLISTRQ